jgi:hypothetical protein
MRLPEYPKDIFDAKASGHMKFVSAGSVLVTVIILVPTSFAFCGKSKEIDTFGSIFICLITQTQFFFVLTSDKINVFITRTFSMFDLFTTNRTLTTIQRIELKISQVSCSIVRMFNILYVC